MSDAWYNSKEADIGLASDCQLEEERRGRMLYQIAWGVLIIAFGILEGITVGMVCIWFCIGSVAALIACMMGMSLPVQIGVFAIVSVVCMILIRPLTKKHLIPKTEKTNADRILGAEAIVTERIDNLQSFGQVQVAGNTWTARSAEESEQFQVGTRVRVLRIEGVKAIVAQIE